MVANVAKVQSMSISQFMSGQHKKKRPRLGTAAKTSISLPIVGALSTKYAFAAETEAIPAGAADWMGEKTLQALAHVLDPVVDIMVALSFPVASVIIVGACFFFMLGNSERAWGTITNASLGYVLIQVSPLILNVLKQIGNAV